MTPKELFHRICDTVDGAEVDSDRPRDTYEMILHAGATLCAVGLREIEEPSRERLLQDVEGSIRRILNAWAEAAAERAYSMRRNPYAIH